MKIRSRFGPTPEPTPAPTPAHACTHTGAHDLASDGILSRAPHRNARAGARCPPCRGRDDDDNDDNDDDEHALGTGPATQVARREPALHGW